jgi:hypothetical protein
MEDGDGDGKGKAPAVGWAHVAGLIEILRYLSETHAMRFYQNTNDINDPSAIRTLRGKERAGKGRGSSRQRTPAKGAGKTPPSMLGYM